MHARLGSGSRERVLVLAPVVVFVAATTRWLRWDIPIREHFAGDVDDYEKIARAAPHFTWPQIEGHISMWPVHYVIGVTAKATHVPLHLVYYVFEFAVLACMLVVVDRLLRETGADRAVYVLAMSALLLDAYVFRYLALAPGMINDAVFSTSLSLTTLALLRRRLRWVVLGLTLAALSRSLTLPPALAGALVWVLLGPWHGPRLGAERVRDAALAFTVPVAILAVAYWAGLQTPGHAPALKDCCGIADITIWGDIAGLPGSAGHLAVHLARIALGVAVPLALLAAGAFLVWRRGARVQAEGWACLGLAAIVIAQPLLISSTWNAGAEPRLTALAVGPVLAAGAYFLAAGEARFAQRDLLVLIALFALASLSHRFAAVGPHTSGQFAALALTCAVAVAVWTAVRNARRFGARTTEA